MLEARDLAVLRVLIGYTRWHTNIDDGIQVGECIPAVPTLAAKTGFARNTVRLALEELERWRFISRKRRVTDDRGQDLTYLFRLCDRLVTAGKSGGA